MAKKNEIFLVEESTAPLLVENQPEVFLVEETSKTPVLVEEVSKKITKSKTGTIKTANINKKKKDVLRSQSIDLKQYTKYIEEGYKSKCFKKLQGDIVIPSGVVKIGNEAFMECDKIKSITIPDSVTSIGRFAFAYCSELISITIGSNVRNIDMFAFDECTNLVSVTIPEGVESIGISAFKGCCRLSSINLAKSIKNIHSRAFEGCYALNKISIPQGTRYQFMEMYALEDYTQYFVETGNSNKNEISHTPELANGIRKYSKLKSWLNSITEVLSKK